MRGPRALLAGLMMLGGLCVAFDSAAEDFRAPWGNKDRTVLETNESVAFRSDDGTQPTRLMIRGYQEYVGTTKGNPCPMSPSCSHYSLNAYRLRPPIVAFLMTVDRLNRCGHDLIHYDVIVLHDRVFRYDPVEYLAWSSSR